MKLTPEQRRRRRAEYSVRVAALCFAVMVGFYAASGEPQEEEATVPSEEAIVAQEPPEQEVRAIPEPVEQRNPLDDFNKLEGATLTHYCICEKCCGKTPEHPAYGITASGREAEPYTSIAVDPLLIPMGAYILIDYGDGEVLVGRADDTGSAIDGSHIDLCVSSHEEALEEGVKIVDVYWKEETRIIKD